MVQIQHDQTTPLPDAPSDWGTFTETHTLTESSMIQEIQALENFTFSNDERKRKLQIVALVVYFADGELSSEAIMSLIESIDQS